MIAERFTEFWSSHCLNDLTAEQLIALLESDLFISANEYQIYCFCKEWTLVDPQDRVCQFNRILHHIRFSVMRNLDLNKVSQDCRNPYLSKADNLSKELKQAANYHNHPEKHLALHSKRTMPRGTTPYIVCIGRNSTAGITEDEFNLQMEELKLMYYPLHLVSNQTISESRPPRTYKLCLPTQYSLPKDETILAWEQFLFIASQFKRKKSKGRCIVFF